MFKSRDKTTDIDLSKTYAQATDNITISYSNQPFRVGERIDLTFSSPSPSSANLVDGTYDVFSIASNNNSFTVKAPNSQTATGNVQVKATYAPAIIVGTKSWSMTISKDVQETTVQSSTSRTYIPSLISGEGSATIMYDTAYDTQRLAGIPTYEFMKGVLLPEGGIADAKFELYPKSSISKKIVFKGLITSAEYGAAVGEVQEFNVSFISSDTIASDI